MTSTESWARGGKMLFMWRRGVREVCRTTIRWWIRRICSWSLPGWRSAGTGMRPCGPGSPTTAYRVCIATSAILGGTIWIRQPPVGLQQRGWVRRDRGCLRRRSGQGQPGPDLLRGGALEGQGEARGVLEYSGAFVERSGGASIFPADRRYHRGDVHRRVGPRSDEAGVV